MHQGREKAPVLSWILGKPRLNPGLHNDMRTTPTFSLEHTETRRSLKDQNLVES